MKAIIEVCYVPSHFNHNSASNIPAYWNAAVVNLNELNTDASNIYSLDPDKDNAIQDCKNQLSRFGFSGEIGIDLVS